MATIDKMIDKKLKIDLSPLWNQNIGKFTVRFQDINETQKRILAQRIKDVARQTRIRNIHGPNVQLIYETLLEINPIIFGEYHQREAYRQVTGYRVFNINSVRAMNGFWFHQVCQAIYMIDCLKRDLTKKEMTDIVYLTCQDWDTVQRYVSDNYRIQDPEETERRPLLEDLGMDDIAHARQIADENGANRIPTGVFEEEHENILDEIIDGRENIVGTMHRLGTEMLRTVTDRPRNTNQNIERIENEIRQIRDRRNPAQPGTSENNRFERDRENRIQELRNRRDREARQMQEIRMYQGEERNREPERTNFEGMYEEIQRDEQEPERHTWAVDPGTFRRVDYGATTLRPEGMIVDEVEHNDEDGFR